MKLFCYILCLRSLCKLFFYVLLLHRVALVMNNENDPKYPKPSQQQATFNQSLSVVSASASDGFRIPYRLRNRHYCCHKIRCRVAAQPAAGSGLQTEFRAVYRILRLRCLCGGIAVSGDVVSRLFIRSHCLFRERVFLVQCVHSLRSFRLNGISVRRIVFAGDFPASCHADSRAAQHAMVCSVASLPGRGTGSAGSDCTENIRIGLCIIACGLSHESLCGSLCAESALIRS